MFTSKPTAARQRRRGGLQARLPVHLPPPARKIPRKRQYLLGIMRQILGEHAEDGLDFVHCISSAPAWLARLELNSLPLAKPTCFLLFLEYVSMCSSITDLQTSISQTRRGEPQRKKTCRLASRRNEIKNMMLNAARLRRCPFGALLKRHCPILPTSNDSQPADGYCMISSQPETTSDAQSRKVFEGTGSGPSCIEPSSNGGRVEQDKGDEAPKAGFDRQTGIASCQAFTPRQDCQQGAQVLSKTCMFCPTEMKYVPPRYLLKMKDLHFARKAWPT